MLIGNNFPSARGIITTVLGIKIVTSTLVTLYENASLTTTLVLLVLHSRTSLALFYYLAGAVLRVFIDFTC
jgi:hypothetical protein